MESTRSVGWHQADGENIQARARLIHVIVHCIFIGVTILLFVLVPVLRKLLNRIDTSVDLGEGEDIKSIELEDEE